MLQAIRDRAQGIFAWIMLIAIGIPFALWGIQNYIDTGKEQPAAVIGDREIFDREVSRAYEQTLANLVGVAAYDDKQLRREALERLVREEVIYQSADAKSFAVSDAEVRAFIQTLPYFQTEGRFDKEKYKVMLAAQNMSPNELVAQVQRALLMEQFQKGVADSAFVTGDQVQATQRLRNQERTVEYVRIPLKPSGKVFPDAEIEAYYREHLADFRNPEQVSVEYVALSLDDVAKNVHITDGDLRNLYDEHKANLGTPERRKLSHILISVNQKNPEADKLALDKIRIIQQRLASGEDFAKLAAEFSEDSVSAKQGGNLGFIDRDAMEEPFSKAAYELKPGQVSEPVRTSYGYHLVKLTELVPGREKSFEEAKDELRKSAQHNAAENKFYELGQVLTEQSYEHPDSLEPAAKQINSEIKQSGLFTRDGGEGIAADPAIRSAAFSDDVLNGRNSDPVEIGSEKAVVLRIKEHRPASDKSLSEVKDLIIAKLRDLDARNEAGIRVAALRKQVQSGLPLAEAAKASGLDVIRLPAVRRTDEKLPLELVNAIFRASRPVNGVVVPGSVELENGDQAVFSVLAVKEGEVLAGDTNEQKSVLEFLSRSGGQREFAALVARLREIADVQLKPDS